MIRRTVKFTGRVQGVGFRATTSSIARRHEVTGTVENLPDGRVRLVAEGEAAAVEAFIKDVQDAMDRHIQSSDKHDADATGEFDGFAVRH